MLDLALRFAIGATVVGLALWTSDNVDARLGGVLSAVPKTSAVSLFVIAVEHGGTFAAETAVSSLFGIGAVILYATTFALVPRLAEGSNPSVWQALVVGLVVYLSVVSVYLFGLEARVGLAVNLAVVVVAYLAARLALRHARAEGSSDPRASPAPPGPQRASIRYLIPALVGGSLVLGATLAADLLGPVWGGIASVFPANVTTVLVSGGLLLEPQAAFDQAAGVPDGVAAAGVFLLGLHLLLPLVHVVAAGLAGYLAWALAAWGLSSFRGPGAPG